MSFIPPNTQRCPYSRPQTIRFQKPTNSQKRSQNNVTLVSNSRLDRSAPTETMRAITKPLPMELPPLIAVKKIKLPPFVVLMANARLIGASSSYISR